MRRAPAVQPPMPTPGIPAPASAVCKPESLGIGLARVGQADQRIISGTLKELAEVRLPGGGTLCQRSPLPSPPPSQVDFGAPLHSLILVGAMHDLEVTLFERFRWRGEGPRWVPPAQPAAPSDGDSGDEGGVGGGGAAASSTPQ